MAKKTCKPSRRYMVGRLEDGVVWGESNPHGTFRPFTLAETRYDVRVCLNAKAYELVPVIPKRKVVKRGK